MAFPLETIFKLGVEVTGSNAVKGLSKDLDNVKNSTDKVTKAFQSLSSINSSITTLQRSLVGLASAFYLKEITGSILEAGVKWQQFNRILEVSVGPERVADSLQFIRKVSDSYGLSLEELTDKYSKLAAAVKGTSTTYEDIQNTFLGLAKASATLGLSSDAVSKVFTAVQQIAQKGKVSAEEVRGQLGEKLAGAFNLAAKAAGVTTAELDKFLQQGRVASIPFFREFGRVLNDEFSVGAEKAAQSAQAAFQRLQNAIFDLKVEAANAGILDAFADAARKLTDALKDPQVVANVKGIASGFADLINLIAQNADKLELVLQVIVGLKGASLGAGAVSKVTKNPYAIGLGALVGAGAGVAGMEALSGQMKSDGDKYEKTADQVGAQIERARSRLRDMLTRPLKRGQTEANRLSDPDIQKQVMTIAKLQLEYQKLSGAMKDQTRLTMQATTGDLGPVIVPGLAKDDPVQNRLETLKRQRAELEFETAQFEKLGVKIRGSTLSGIEADLGNGGALRDADGARAAKLRAIAKEIDQLKELQRVQEGQEQTDKIIRGLNAEASAIGQSNLERQNAIQIKDLENRGIREGTALYDQYVAKIKVANTAKVRAEENFELVKYSRELANSTQQIIKETESLGLNKVELEIVTANREIDNEVRQRSIGLTEEGIKALRSEAEAQKAAREAAIRSQDIRAKSGFTGLKQGVNEYLEGLNNAAEKTKQLFNTVVSSLEDTLVTFFTTGKLGIKEFAFTIVTELTRAAVQMLILKPIIESFKNAMDTFSVGGGGGGGGFSGLFDFGKSLFGFANGGVMTNSGAMPLQSYANGGIANKPQLALFGEGRMNEAYVPLPDGRTIPVTMQGNAGGGDTSVVVNVSVEKGNADVSANGGKKADELGRLIAGVVKQELLNQKRPGGLLAA